MFKTKPKTRQSELTALSLVANLRATLAALCPDLPIQAVQVEGDCLVIILAGGVVQRFPIDQGLVLKIKTLDSPDRADEALRLALSALGWDKHSPAGWLPDPAQFRKE